ncbi:DUF2949 domain-containing protein [Chamaesiphon sp. VAR_48_metabat_135_sub]|uniref:DUF2949 domain-containing protein n=1 Tax=Chamaesiphon sp. VAR_48_metabat_135_sub TaxID=2964699 RepID=UPI00286A7DB1|nr:DUF2949 domain-containing protein [Chamaesiphon sp. VAR_48_metabat_135_sub]
MSKHDIPQVVNFLRQNLNLSNDSVQLALKQSQSDYHSLPIILWQYGLVSLPELDRVYDWFESYIY